MYTYILKIKFPSMRGYTLRMGWIYAGHYFKDIGYRLGNAHAENREHLLGASLNLSA
jgi:hypothetical protein